MANKILNCFLLLVSLISCASMHSGHYIQIKNGQTLESLSKSYKVPLWELKAANRGRSIASGSWVFVPLKRGILGKTKSFYDPKAYLESGDFSWPVPSSTRVSSHFGARWGKDHEGIDIPARRGASIVSMADGVVVYAGNRMGGYGNITVISHHGGIFSVYAHAKKNFTRKGQKVHKGQVIAEVGTTGRSTGPHLHFEVRHNSEAIDPLKFLAFDKR